jgi:hypothetical protein
MDIFIQLKQFIINSFSGIVRLFRRKKISKDQVPPIQMAILSGSIRRVK